MKPGKNFIERALSDSINCAVNQAVKNPYGPDPFGSALKSSMDWYALTLPAALQHDRVTNKETIPCKRQVTVNSYKNQNAKPKHRLIKEVKGSNIVFNQPLAYTVKTGDTLSEIAWKFTNRRASVQDLKNWNTIFSDTIRPGQVVKLADPDDKLVKEAIAKLSKSELSSRNPSINLHKLSREMVIQHGGLLEGNYQVQIKIEYNEPWQYFLNPEMFDQTEQVIPWAPGYSGKNRIRNYDEQTHYPEEVRLEGGEFKEELPNDPFKHLKTAGSVIRGGASIAKIVEAEYLAQATINNAIKGLSDIPIKTNLNTISKIAKLGGYTGIAASLGMAGVEYYNETDNTSTWINAGINTVILGSGIIAITIGSSLLATIAGVAGVAYGVSYFIYGDEMDAYIDIKFGYR